MQAQSKTIAGLQIIFQNLSDKMSGGNIILLDIYEDFVGHKLL